MKRLILISLLLTGCATSVPVRMSFPQAPESLTKPAEELQALDPNKKKLSDLLENANNNYGEYHKLKQQNDAWIEWYNTQRKLFEDVK
jgi:hypothetical protein|tara:strand:- start:784 stop:1047 length:264 start_codon:yes stop_codon:yes gene_type:complete